MKKEMRTPLVKMCGMTREEDAASAIKTGADAIGMIFYASSPRNVSIAQAARIATAVGSTGLKVGLFVNADKHTIDAVLADVPLEILQFHGDESEAFCAGFGLPFWKTLRPREAAALPAQIAAYPKAEGILLDTWHPTKAGGTGEKFDWSMLDGIDQPAHLILAGGLDPENVGEAIRQVRPWAVDVCSGIESSPGIKSATRMQDFMTACREAANS